MSQRPSETAAGGVIGEVHAGVRFHEGFAQSADDLLHGGGAVGGDGAGESCGDFGLGSGGGLCRSPGRSGGSGGLALSAAGHGDNKHGNQCNGNDFLHNLTSPCRFYF